MKHLILTIFLLSSSIAYGQDLVITIAGDSIKCRLVRVEDTEVQFRINNGPVVHMDRRGVASFQYNYATAAPTTSTSRRETRTKNADPIYNTPAQVPARTMNDFTRFNAGLMGAYNHGIIIGLNGAYFFNHYIGAGFAYRYQGNNTGGYYINSQTFFGPVLFGKWGRRNSKFYFPTNFGLGFSTCRSSEYDNYYGSYYDHSKTGLGVFTSAGVAYRASTLISNGLNHEVSAAFGFGLVMGPYSLGVHFHF